MTAFDQAADKAYQTLTDIEISADAGDDDKRFFASYLLGHVSLIAADGGESAESLTRRVNESLDDAFAVDRLSDQDKLGIRSLWQAISADIGREL
ncbi:YfcL family protein [Marinobacterium sp. YM272]|uniref:YfcL family protein n=1 Tax=Marinobacterium sp. YM272 TaxID=3421654 RepID=UPI003D7FDB1A